MSAPIAVVLAAGKGTRMKSDSPKVLFPVLGRPMIHFVLDALSEAGIHDHLVVVGYQAERVQEELAGREGVQFVLQDPQLGTGHAVQMCRPQLQSHTGPVLVLAGDSPLVQPASLRQLLARFSEEQPSLLLGTLERDDPTGLGRIVRDASGEFVGIVEEKDATDAQRAIREVNMSTYLFACQPLLAALNELRSDNSQSEYYLTDCAALLRKAGHRVEAAPVLQACESLSINTRDQLAAVEAKMREMGYRCAT